MPITAEVAYETLVGARDWHARACLDIPRIKSFFSALTQKRMKKLKAGNGPQEPESPEEDENDDNDERDANNQARQFLMCCAVSMLRVLRG